MRPGSVIRGAGPVSPGTARAATGLADDIGLMPQGLVQKMAGTGWPIGFVQKGGLSVGMVMRATAKRRAIDAIHLPLGENLGLGQDTAGQTAVTDVDRPPIGDHAPDADDAAAAPRLWPLMTTFPEMPANQSGPNPARLT